MLTVTPAAAAQILQAIEAQQGDPETFCLRVAAKIEEGEIVYGMGFDEQREHDAVVVSCGVKLLVAPRSQELLRGTTLDFVELAPGEFKFVFINPNEPPAPGGCISRSSGCGSCGGGSCG